MLFVWSIIEDAVRRRMRRVGTQAEGLTKRSEVTLSGRPKNDKFLPKVVVFYSSRRLGMESRVCVYGITEGAFSAA